MWNDDRSDEEQIGATYPELEWAMDFNGDDHNISNREEEVLTIYNNLRKINLHKMMSIPTCKIPGNLK